MSFNNETLENVAADAATFGKVLNDPVDEPNGSEAPGTVTSRLGEVYQNVATAMRDAVAYVTSATVGFITGTFAEDWDAVTTWADGARVLHEGIYYYALSENTNQEPFVGSSYWEVALDRFTGGTLTSNVTLAASTVTEASLTIPSGSEPTTPTTGDVWRESSRLKHELTGSVTNDIMQPFVPESWPTGLTVRTNIDNSSGWESFTGSIPYDDTTPLVSEGAEIFTGSYTPRMINNDYVIEVSLCIYMPAVAGLVFTVFEDSTCIKTHVETFTAAAFQLITFSSTPRNISSLTAKTISLRVGGASASKTVYMNGHDTAGLFNGTCGSNMTAIEMAEYTP